MTVLVQGSNDCAGAGIEMIVVRDEAQLAAAAPEQVYLQLQSSFSSGACRN